ncbi:hypothetical protein TcBrA4_0096560 [Trypanosoma cruzi]|nr:hypothetical protein TcBrA4_0096560 [Trypanosoma cruzi]
MRRLRATTGTSWLTATAGSLRTRSAGRRRRTGRVAESVVLLDCRVGSLLMVFQGAWMRHERRRDHGTDRGAPVRRGMHCTGHAYAPLKASTQQCPAASGPTRMKYGRWSRVEFEGEDWDYVLR